MVFSTLGSDQIEKTGVQGGAIELLVYEALETFWGGSAQSAVDSVVDVLESSAVPTLTLEWLLTDDAYDVQIAGRLPWLIRERVKDAQHHWFHIDQAEQIAGRLVAFSDTLKAPK